jgi:hypothetical protein
MTARRSCFHAGYGKQFRALKGYLSKQPKLIDRVAVIGKEDPMVTGNFEVTVIETGEVVHSKKHGGQGKAESLREREAIVTRLVEILEE